MNNKTLPELPDSQYRGGNDVFGKEFPLYTADQMHQYARDYAAMLAAAPAASGGEDVGRADCGACPKPIGCKVGQCRHGLDNTPESRAPQLPPAAPVSERARALMAQAYRDGGFPRAAGILEAGVIDSVDSCALRAIEQALTQQRGEVEDEDYHVIMSMGRLLAEIAVILKGAEPAGTAWSYHDLPELVKSAVENAHDIASEMRAWAAVKMRERGSSRRDKMMVEEWSKRLLALPEVAFPVKDFDIPGLSITKEEIRFAIRKVVADRVFIGQDFGGTTPQPSADAVRDVPDGMVLVPREPTPEMVRAGAIVTDHVTRAIQVYSAMLSAASGEVVERG